MTRLLGPPLTDAERAVVLTEAHKLLGVRWRHKGRTERGVDCIGSVYLTLARALLALRGLILPLPRDDYGRTPFNRQLRAGLIDWLGDPFLIDDSHAPLPGDVVTLRWTGEEHHVAMVVPHPFYGIGLIHADNTATGGPRVVEHGVDALWRSALVEAFRP